MLERRDGKSLVEFQSVSAVFLNLFQSVAATSPSARSGFTISAFHGLGTVVLNLAAGDPRLVPGAAASAIVCAMSVSLPGGLDVSDVSITLPSGKLWTPGDTRMPMRCGSVGKEPCRL